MAYLLAAALIGGIVLSAVGVAAAPTSATLEVVGRSALGDRGMNAALAVADNCAYVGSRNDAGPLVVDITNPAAPQVAGQLAGHPGGTPRELRTVASLHELAVMYYNLNGGSNRFDLYRWSADCRTPSLVGSYDFGSASPHEFFLWEDPQHPARVLLYVAMFASGNALNVLDISDPTRPTRVGGWSVPAGYGAAKLHSIALSTDGRIGYLSLWMGGFAVADSGDFATGSSQPALRLLTPQAGVYRTPPGDVHSAVPVPGRALVVTTDERYPSPYGQGCPYGTAHVVDVSSPAWPVASSVLAVPENDPGQCAAVATATWTSHNPTLTANLALISWYSGGLQVFGLDDPAHPQRLTEMRPGGVTPRLRDVQLGTTSAMTWSYPVIFRGLIYVVDINQGLVILRYSGPHQDEVANLQFSEGNSNLVSATSATATSPRTPAPGPAPVSPSGSPALGRHNPANGAAPLLLWGAVLVVPAIVGAAIVARRRARKRSRTG